MKGRGNPPPQGRGKGGGYFAGRGRGGKKGGRGGYPGGHNGKSAPGARWVKDGADSSDSTNSEKGSPTAAVYTATGHLLKDISADPAITAGNSVISPTNVEQTRPRL